MLYIIPVIIGAGRGIRFGCAEYCGSIRFDNPVQHCIKGTVDGIVVVVALNRLDSIEAVNRLQIIHAGKGSNQVFCSAHHIAEGHGAVLDLTFMVQANKAAGITILICAIYIISGTASKYIVSGRNACYAAAVNVGSVALDEVDFYIGDFVFIYAAVLRTGQFNDRVTDGDNGKVALVRSCFFVECNADF